ncbi:MAG TPA: MauE/DoxX family redox-associated membrane protein [Sphingobium sp.]|uniref:MauE/DoxX family redox-associated membrane protein n=1 Tax=Sphingobium sp. TaxID=1912891 RepID=UPI002ED62C8E
MMLSPEVSAGGLAVAGLAGSIAVGLIFLTAGGQKLRHRAILPGVIANYRILPERLVGPLAAVLPVLEIATGLALIAGVAPLPALTAILLLLLFAAAMAVNIARGRRQIDCGCGGPELRQALSWVLVLRNLLLAALLLPRLLLSDAQSAFDQSALDLTPVDLFTAAAAGLGIFLAYMLFQTVGSLIAAHPVASRR